MPKPHAPPSAVSPSRHPTMPNVKNQKKWKEIHVLCLKQNYMQSRQGQREGWRDGGRTKNTVSGLRSHRNACFAVCGEGSGPGVGHGLSNISNTLYWMYRVRDSFEMPVFLLPSSSQRFLVSGSPDFPICQGRRAF